MNTSSFRIATLAEELELIQGMNKSTGRDVGIYPEIKSPEFHLAEGKDLGRAVVAELKAYGYTSKEQKVFLQTFSWEEVKRLRDEILPETGIDLKLVMLVGDDEEYQWMFNESGMQEVGRYADGFGPDKSLLIAPDSTPGNLRISTLWRLRMPTACRCIRILSGQTRARWLSGQVASRTCLTRFSSRLESMAPSPIFRIVR